MGKHLNLSQRMLIESNLSENTSLRKIGTMLGKPHTTISREILSRRVLVKGNRFNNFNTKCERTTKAPFVCNGCPNKNKCKKKRYFYYAEDAHNDYFKTLVESRQGIDFENDDFRKMDTVEGIKGHSVLLTLNFVPFNFMIAYKLENQTISEVTGKINKLKEILGYELFHKMFPVILTDNGKEFKRPYLIEDNGNDVVKTKVFFCDSRRSDQKGSIEVTHEYIRRFIKQGIDLDKYSDDDILLMMNHINNTKRKKLDSKTPFELMEEKLGKESIKKLGFYFIPPQDIILKPSLFNKDNNK